jgi:hypothetical protein
MGSSFQIGVNKLDCKSLNSKLAWTEIVADGWKAES